jgi:transmembrane 9 superfamily member 3
MAAAAPRCRSGSRKLRAPSASAAAALLPLILLLLLTTPAPTTAESWFGGAARLRAIGGEDGYQQGDALRLLVNKAGPYANPSETFNYHRLPFCRPKPDEKPRREWGGLGEVLLGNQPEDSQVEGIEFAVDADEIAVCSQVVTEEDAREYREIVQRHYYYEWLLDGLPVWGFVGEMRPPKDDDAEAEDGQDGGEEEDDDAANGRRRRRRASRGEEDDPEEDQDEEEGDNNVDAFGDRRRRRIRPSREGRGGGEALSAAARAQQRGQRLSRDDLLLEPRVHGPPMQVWVYTHRQLSVATNHEPASGRRHVVEVNLTSSQPRLVEPGRTLRFTLSVKWREAPGVTFAERFERYLDSGFFEHRVRWFALANSFVMALFLVAVVAAILARTLRADLMRAAAAARSSSAASAGGADLEALERDLAEESGWKLLSGDVFRAPPRLAALCACVGTGAQLAAMAVAGTFAALLGAMHEDRGAVLSTLIASYCVASLLGGYVSGGMYARRTGGGGGGVRGGGGGGGAGSAAAANDGSAAATTTATTTTTTSWPRVMLMTWALFPGLVFAVGGGCNLVAVWRGSLAAVPATTVIALLALWLLLALPLAALGTSLGRARAAGQVAAAAGGGGGGGGKGFVSSSSSSSSLIFRVKRLPTPVPPRPWFSSRAALALAAGALPFASSFTELFFVFSSLHGFRVYYSFGFLMLAELSFLLVAALASVVVVFALLQREDWRWPWAAFGAGASTAVYVALYLGYYYLRHTRMQGLLQACFFFGYGLLGAAGIGLIAGSVALGAASAFVSAIYQASKSD